VTGLPAVAGLVQSFIAPSSFSARAALPSFDVAPHADPPGTGPNKAVGERKIAAAARPLPGFGSRKRGS